MTDFQLITLIVTILGSGAAGGLGLGKMILDLQGRMSAVEGRLGHVEGRLAHVEGLLEGFRASGVFAPPRIEKAK